jgi:hypothetical protein
MDELLVHQIPEPLPNTAVYHPHWRESYFFIAHRPDALGDVVILTMATYPQRQQMDSVQMGRVGGRPVLGYHVRPFDGDPHTADVGAARVEVVRPFEELRLWADPDRCELGMDLTFRARTKPYGLRRGTMRAGHELIWDQSHLLQSLSATPPTRSSSEAARRRAGGRRLTSIGLRQGCGGPPTSPTGRRRHR